MDGLLIGEARSCVAGYLIATLSICHLVSSICAARDLG